MEKKIQGCCKEMGKKCLPRLNKDLFGAIGSTGGGSRTNIAGEMF